MAVHPSPTPAAFPRRSCRTVAAALRTLDPRLRETVILVYCLLGGRSSRLNDRRRVLLDSALAQIAHQLGLCPLHHHAEVETMQAIRRRLAADLGLTTWRRQAPHAA